MIIKLPITEFPGGLNMKKLCDITRVIMLMFICTSNLSAHDSADLISRLPENCESAKVISENTEEYDFIYDGISYTVVDEELKTCRTKCGGKGPNGGPYIGANDLTGDIEIPSNVLYNSEVYTVTEVGDFSFFNCDEITSIKISDSVLIIGESAFSGAANMSGLVLGQSVSVIKDYAFAYCRNIASVKLPESAQSIGHDVFSGCLKLEHLTLPSHLQYIPSNFVHDCPCLKSVCIPSNVLTIGRDAFSFTGLKEVILPEGLEVIECNAFRSCSDLEKIDIPSSVCELQAGVFEYCISLKEVKLPQGIKYIGNCTFKESGIERIDIPEGVEMIMPDKSGNSQYDEESGAFGECKNLRYVSFPSTLRSIGRGAFRHCISLSEIEWSEGLEEIGPSAFYNCRSLTELKFPNSLKVIKDGEYEMHGDIGYDTGAFGLNEKLKRVFLPSKIDHLGFNIFRGSRMIEEIVYPTSEPIEVTFELTINPLDPDTDVYLFSDEVYENAELILSIGGLENARKTEPWCRFKNITELDFSNVAALDCSNSESDGVYRMDGVCMGYTTDGLPSGLYIMHKDGRASNVMVP